MLTVIVLVPPTAVPAAPESVGVVFFVDAPFAGVERPTAGAVVSTRNVLAPLKPVLPAESSCWARTVYVPSASAGEGFVDHELPETVVVNVWTGVPEALEPL